MEVKVTGKKRFTLLTKRDLQEIIKYRDLIYMLVKRDISGLYKQTVLGFTWAILRPLVQMFVFTLFFGSLAGFGKDTEVPYAVFSYCALVPWTYFSVSINLSTGSLISNSQLLTKVYFPRVIIPLSPVISKLVDFVLSLSVLIVLLIYFGIYPTYNLAFLPLFILLLITFVLGCSFWLSAVAIQYRDVRQAMTFGIQLFMYAAPIIWPLKYVPEEYRLLLGVYPMVGIIEGFRSSFLGDPVPWQLVGIGAIVNVILLVTGILFFRNQEDKFADVV